MSKPVFEPTPAQWLEYSRCAALNAKRLAESAHLVAEGELWGPSCSLTVLAIEEHGKARFGFIAALGVIPKRVDLARVLRMGHRPKQMMAALPPLASVAFLFKELVGDLDLNAYEHVDPQSEEGRQLVARTLQHFTSRLPLLDNHRHLLEPLAFQVQQTSHYVLAQGTLDKLKQRGFYVDFNEETQEILDPATLTEDGYKILRAQFDPDWRESGEFLATSITAHQLTIGREATRMAKAAMASGMDDESP